MNALTVGTVIDETFRLEGYLGTGAMGSVHKALQQGLNRHVAIKFLAAECLENEEICSRFMRESKVLCQLQHPNIVSFYCYGVWQSRYPYFAMEYVDGINLNKRLESGPLEDAETLYSIAIQLCNGLARAHEAGILHRDIKPSNIMVGPGDRVRLVDFGLSLITGSKQNQHLTQAGTAVGTLDYISPEICRGQVADQRSDIYSLGCVLYECLVGHPPFHMVHDSLSKMYQHIHAKPDPIADAGNNIAAFAPIIDRCLEKDPSERFQTVSDLCAAIEDWRKGQPIARKTLKKRLSKEAFAAIKVVAVLAASFLIGTMLINARPAIQAMQPTMSASRQPLSPVRQNAQSGALTATMRTALKPATFNNLDICGTPMQRQEYRSLIESARAKIIAHDYAKADGLLLRAKLLLPQCNLAYELSASVLGRQNRLDEAIINLDSAIREFHYAFNSYVLRSIVLKEQQKLILALHDINVAIAMRPDVGSLYSYRADLYDSLGKSREADEDRQTSAKSLAQLSSIEDPARIWVIETAAGVRTNGNRG